MALPQNTGILDLTLGYVVPLDTTTWTDTTSTTWESFANWSLKPANPLVWVGDEIDAGSVIDFNLQITSNFEGTMVYDIYVSDTGLFNGEETVHTISEGDTNVACFRGRFCRVVAKVYRTSGLNVLKSMSSTISRRYYDIVLNDIDTSSLSGDKTGRTLSLGKNVGKVLAMSILARDVRENGYFTSDYIALGYVGDATDGYVANDYWTDGYTLSAYIPMVWPFQVSKDRNGPVICLRNEYGEYLDGEVDVVIKVLPEQYMSNGQLLIR